MKRKWRKENAETRVLISQILRESKRQEADRISIGTPVDHVARPVQTDLQQNSEGFDELAQLEKEMATLGIAPVPVYSRTPSISIPIWFRIGGTWHQVDSIPFRILHDVIGVLEKMFLYDAEIDKSSQKNFLKLVDSNEPMYVELWFEDNFTYTIATHNFDNK